MRGSILILNAGSSSIKFTLFGEDLAEGLSGMAEAIGGNARLKIGDRAQDCALPDHASAMQKILEGLEAEGVGLRDLRAAGHRVVHGGTALTAPQRITPETRAAIEACIPLAPLHNPHNLTAIDALAALAPELPQFASFDTAFHITNPDVATHYALPQAYAERGIRRYGFHGLSYSALVRNYSRVTGMALPARVLACHLGNGASLCAIREGKSVATTMGYSPLEGLTMGTRAGSIDGNAILRLGEEDGLEETRALLNNRSGLLGLSGLSADMRRLAEDSSKESAFAIEHFCYWVARHADSMVAAMEGCDAIVFTGGIGENAVDVRGRILRHLAWLGVTAATETQGRPCLSAQGSAVAAWVIKADEEREIARDVQSLLRV